MTTPRHRSLVTGAMIALLPVLAVANAPRQEALPSPTLLNSDSLPEGLAQSYIGESCYQCHVVEESSRQDRPGRSRIAPNESAAVFENRDSVGFYQLMTNLVAALAAESEPSVDTP